MVQNVWVAVGIASPSLSAQMLFLLPFSQPTINRALSSDVGRCLANGNVGNDIAELGIVANVGEAIGIAPPSLSVHKLFLIPVL
jgi:hypothetical protein